MAVLDKKEYDLADIGIDHCDSLFFDLRVKYNRYASKKIS
jgi:hypothetical protein